MNINMNPNSELHQSVVTVPNVVQVPEALVSQAAEFKAAIMMYTCAIREVKTKLEVLNDELSVRNQRNPIEMIKSRVKKPMSIVEKLRRRTILFVTNNIEEAIYLGDRIVLLSKRPAVVKEIYDLSHLPRPRDNVSRSFMEMRKEITDAMDLGLE